MRVRVTNEEDNQEAATFFRLWVTHTMNAYRKLGSWKKIEVLIN
jgi:hypothetical protein